MISEIVVIVLISICTSIICNRILAIHTFKVIDGYVNELIDMEKKLIRDTYMDK